MSWSALPDSFEYLCHGPTAIVNIFTLTARGSTLDTSTHHCAYRIIYTKTYRRQILTSKVYPRAVRVKLNNVNLYPLLTYGDPQLQVGEHYSEFLVLDPIFANLNV